MSQQNVNVVVLPTPEAACARVADIIEEVILAKPDAVLGLPAGKTPLPVYQDLVGRSENMGGRVSFRGVRAFGLDEYAGLAPGHPASFAHMLVAHLYAFANLRVPNVASPDATAVDLDEACRTYERAIAAAGGFDLCFLGIGGNGHVAFNEPGSPFDSRTRVVDLAADTRAAAAAAFGGKPVPARALTIGIATILSARRCVLLAYGAAKAAVVARAIQEPPSPALPASALQLHPNATFILDAAAASRLA